MLPESLHYRFPTNESLLVEPMERGMMQAIERVRAAIEVGHAAAAIFSSTPIHQEFSYCYSVDIGRRVSIAGKVKVLPVPRHECSILIRKGVDW